MPAGDARAGLNNAGERRGSRALGSSVREKATTFFRRLIEGGRIEVKRDARAGLNSPLGFDPVVVGEAECAAWAAYYRRDWLGVLRGVLTMVRNGFGLGPVGNLRGAWYVLRANQVWAPDDNDPEAARDLMARFYRLAERAGRIQVDPVRAAELEVDWWRIHRQHQRTASLTEEDLVEALVRLYAWLYGTDPDVVRTAAVQRVEAMAHSDAWVRGGCNPADPLLDAERAALVASYRSLRQVQDGDR